MSTVENFERVLGRPLLWRPLPYSAVRRRLTVRPHALRQANAFYGSLAIQFGRASGERAALREAIGCFEDGTGIGYGLTQRSTTIR
jgi:hypothetical protein